MASKPPGQYEKVKARHPDFVQAVETLGETVRKAGPLSKKDAHLIQLAAAAACRSEGAVHSHVRRALASGASAEEVRHALLLLTNTIGFPQVVAAISWAEDVLEGG